MRSCLSIKMCVFSLFSRISNRHLTYTAYSFADFWASGVYLVCIWKKRDYIAVVPYILVGRARFELATNGLKVRCSTDWATDPVKTEIIAIILFWPWKCRAPILKPQSALLRGDSWQSSPLFPAKSPLQFALDKPHHWALPLLLGY